MTHTAATIKTTITRLASQGDGVAVIEGNEYYFPFTAVGDEVKIALENGKAQLVRILEASNSRQSAPCAYYTACGGCNLQHLSQQAYLAFKQQRLKEALERAGFKDFDIAPVVEVPAASRRRIELKLQVIKKQLLFGFYKAETHDVVAIDACPVAVPEVSMLIAPLKEHLLSLKKPSNISAIQISAYDVGVELLIKAKSTLHARDKTLLAELIDLECVQRVVAQVGDAEDTQMLARTSEPTMRFGDVDVEMPIGAFIQATQKGQDALATAAAAIAAPNKKIADLYAGCGTYSFAMVAKGAQVIGIEGVDAMVMAANNAAKQAKLSHRLRFEKRDLVKHPMPAKDLAEMDAVVINPPRAGAAKQCEQIADAGVKEVVMISCNPATLAKDLSYFNKAGYQVTSATPVDQFVWTGHLEAIVTLRRIV